MVSTQLRRAFRAHRGKIRSCAKWGALVAGLALAGLLVPWAERGFLAREVLLGLAGAADEVHASKPSPAASDRVVSWDVHLPLAGRDGRARFYARRDALDGQQVIVVHGVHYDGIDESRLVRFASELANAGLVVFTPEIHDLTRYRITERSIAQLTDAGRYLVDLGSGGRDVQVGLIGFSFAGGLSLLAGGSPELSDHLRFVASIGGHHDLGRVLRFFMDDRIETPAGTLDLRPHEYGLVVLTYECLEQLLSPRDVPLASQVLRAWLMEDRPLAMELMAEAGSLESEQLFTLLERGELNRLEPRLREALDARQEHLARLSPSGKLSALQAPAYLLHGADDTVIPASETAWADLELAQQEHAALVSPLIRHVEPNGDRDWLEQLRLLSFMARLF